MLRYLILPLALLPLPAVGQTAHPQTPPVPLPSDVQLKPTSPREVIHDPKGGLTDREVSNHLVAGRIYGNFVQVAFKIVVNENGRVESAVPIAGPAEHFAQATRIELARTFEPIRLGDRITRIAAMDAVSILPPEEWGQHVDWPSPTTIHHASVSLERTACFGLCPAYTVRVDETGLVTWDSEDWRAVGRHHTDHISPSSFTQLLDRFRTANFLSANREYVCGWTDMPSQILNLTFNGVSHSVKDYGGATVGLPDAITHLEEAVDDALKPGRWLDWGPDTLPALEAEHWDFGASSRDNLLAYNAALVAGQADALALFVLAHAPSISNDPAISSPLCTASRYASVDRVRLMLTGWPARKPLPSLLLQECLTDAAASGHVETVNFWIDQGATSVGIPRPPRYTGSAYYPTPLLAAIASRTPEVVARILDLDPPLTPAANADNPLLTFLFTEHSGQRPGDESDVATIVRLLLAKGIDPNMPDKRGQLPISKSLRYPQAFHALLEGGANVNGRQWQNRTALIDYAYSEPAVRLLLSAGADPSLVGSDGSTALARANQSNCGACIDLIQKRSPLCPQLGL